MTQWTPEVSVLSEERDAILQLVRLCKLYQTRAQARATALSLSAREFPGPVAHIRERERSFLVSLEEEVEIEYRAIESAILHGTDYVPELQKLLDRRRPRNKN